jgi:hypothetical protein
MTIVIARPMSGSAISTPSATDDGAGDDAETDEGIDAGVVPVGDERGALQLAPGPEPDASGDLVAEVADEPGTASTHRCSSSCGLSSCRTVS